MALDRFVSPGVFTRENDQSFLPQGIAEIGGAFIGPTTKGPAFVPTIVESPEEFQRIFGVPTPQYYVGYAATDYLEDAARATIVRVLGIGGYEVDEITDAGGVILVAEGASGSFPLALIWPSTNQSASLAVDADVSDNYITTASLTFTSATDFALAMTSSDGKITNLTSLSLDPTSANYFVSSLGDAPSSGEAGYVLLNFPSASFLSAGSESYAEVTGITAYSGSDIKTAWDFRTSNYRGAETPWIQSQTLGGKKHDLFKIHTTADGTEANRSIKVSIASIRPANAQLDDRHGKFSVIVRQYDDTDNRVSVLEQFDNLSLDPNSVDYIARRIGDQHWAYDSNDELVQLGEFQNFSDYIYVEMSPFIESVPEIALPVGFGAPYFPLYLGGLGLTDVPTPGMVTTRYQLPISGSTTIENARIYYGWDYSDVTAVSYLSEISENAQANTAATFSLEDVDDTDITLAITNNTVAGSSVRKFTIPLQFGSDGLNPSRVIATGASIVAQNVQGFDLQNQTSSGSVAYVRAINAVSDPESWDINLLVIPGVTYQSHPYVTQYATDMCEDRGDTFYIMDGFDFGTSVNTAVDLVAGLDTNYAGVYHPWVKIFDNVSKKVLWVPPSVVMPGVFAFNDKVAAEWFAPAGLNRGGIDIAVQVEKRLTRQNRDDLYEARINPIALFPGQGVVAFGQKTLQIKPSALDRINVRRLLIAVKKFIASAARYLVFEQNVEATRQRFLNIANPYLASVQERSGLYAFKVIMDESNNTPDLIDRNILVGQIYLQPTRTAEFISLEFNILPTGATFPTGT